MFPFFFFAFVREHIWHKALLMGCSMRLELTRICLFSDESKKLETYTYARTKYSKKYKSLRETTHLIYIYIYI